MEQNGNIITHPKTQRVLGIMETDYQAQELRLQSGTKLFLFSDGITETFGENEELFGEESLIEFLHFHDDLSVREIPSALENKILQFRGSKEQTDDITFIGLSFREN